MVCPTSIKNEPFYGLILDEEQKNFVDSILNPTKKIMYINQPYRRGYRINDGEDYSTQQHNALNVYFKDYMEKGIEVAKLLNIPTLNLYNECGWNEYNVENLTVDGLHPNTTYGYKSIGGIITRFIKNNI